MLKFVIKVPFKFSIIFSKILFSEWRKIIFMELNIQEQIKKHCLGQKILFVCQKDSWILYIINKRLLTIFYYLNKMNNSIFRCNKVIESHQNSWSYFSNRKDFCWFIKMKHKNSNTRNCWQSTFEEYNLENVVIA